MKRHIRNLIQSAVDFEKRTGRRSGITGSIAEEQVIDVLGLERAREQEPGHDATEIRGNRRVKIEIKGSQDPSGRTSRFSQHAPDVVLLGLLDDEYLLREIYEASWTAVRPELTPRRQITIRKFISIGELIWSDD